MARKFAARNFQSAFCQYPAKLKNKSGLMGTSSAFALQVPEQVLGDRAIARLARRQDQFKWQTVGIDARVDLGRQPAARAAHTGIRWLFFKLAAC